MVFPDHADLFLCQGFKVSKSAKIRNQYNQVPHLTQDTNLKVINSQLFTTNESQEVSPFPAADHKVQINRSTQRHNKHKTGKYKRSTKEVPPWNGQINILVEGLNPFHGANLTLNSDVDQDTKIFGLHERRLTYQCIISQKILIKILKGDKAKTRTQQ